jgi:hypothetical protein
MRAKAAARERMGLTIIEGNSEAFLRRLSARAAGAPRNDA